MEQKQEKDLTKQQSFFMKNARKNLIVNCKHQMQTQNPIPLIYNKIKQIKRDNKPIYKKVKVIQQKNNNILQNNNKNDLNTPEQEKKSDNSNDSSSKKPIMLKKQNSIDYYKNFANQKNDSINNDKNYDGVQEYYNELYTLMVKEEKKMIFIENQQIDMFKYHQQCQQSRRILINWIIYESEKLKFTQDVMFRAVQLIDLCLFKCQQKINNNNLQKLGVASLQLALKMEVQEDIVLEDLQKITKGGVKCEEIIIWENNILQCIDYQIFIPNYCNFISWYCDMFDFNLTITNLAMYICESLLYTSYFYKYPQSLISATCCFLANSLYLEQKNYPDKFELVTGYSKREINEIKSEVMKQTLKVRDYSNKDLKPEHALIYKYSKEYYEEIFQLFETKIQKLLQ